MISNDEDLEALRSKIARAIADCERHQRSGTLQAYYRRIQEYLMELDRRVETCHFAFDYLSEFPIGNIIVRVLDGEPDKEMIALLSEIDAAFLRLTNNPEYRQFLHDFDGLL